MNANLFSPLPSTLQPCQVFANTELCYNAEARAFSLHGHFPTLTRRTGGRNKGIKFFPPLETTASYRGTVLVHPRRISSGHHLSVELTAEVRWVGSGGSGERAIPGSHIHH